MNGKLSDINDFKEESSAEELNQQEQVKRYLLENYREHKGDEWFFYNYQDFLQYCEDCKESALCQSPKDFFWAVRCCFPTCQFLISGEDQSKEKALETL